MLSTRNRSVNACRVGSVVAATPVAAALMLATGIGLGVGVPAFADGLPSQAAPAGFRATNGSPNGRILDGALPGATSPTEALHAGLHKLSGYFGGTLDVTSAVQSADGQSTTAFFHATLHGTPVTGMSITALSPKGGAREAAVFDTSARFSQSLPALIAQMKSLPQRPLPHEHAPAAPPEEHVAIPTLHAHEAADNTIGISIPSDWRIVTLAEGRAVVAGPHNEFIQLNMSSQFIIAGSARAQRSQQVAQFTHSKLPNVMPIAPFSDDVAQDYIEGSNAIAQSMGQPDPQIHIDRAIPQKPGWAIINATRVGNGGTRRVVGTVAALRGAYDSWMLSMWTAAGPADQYKRTFPIMMAIENSMTYNAAADQRVKAAGTAMIIASSKAAMAASKSEHEAFMAASESRFQSAMAADRAAQDSIDRSAAGMIHVINGTSVLEHRTTGAHGTFDSDFSQFVAQGDPEHYRVVPLSELRKGVDY